MYDKIDWIYYYFFLGIYIIVRKLILPELCKIYFQEEKNYYTNQINNDVFINSLKSYGCQHFNI